MAALARAIFEPRDIVRVCTKQPSKKHDGQRVRRDYVIEDRDILELHA